MKQIEKSRKVISVLLILMLCIFCPMSSFTARAASSLQLDVEYDESTLTNALEIKVTLQSNSEITVLKYAYARVAKSIYFTQYEENGTTIEKNEAGEYSFFARENGYVSVFAMNKAGEEALHVFRLNNIDSESPKITLASEPLEDFFFVTPTVTDNSMYDVSLRYVEGAYGDVSDEVWKTAKDITNEAGIILNEGKYSFLATDEAGNNSIVIKRFEKNSKIDSNDKTDKDNEFRAVWISYLEFSSNGYTKKEFQKHIRTMFDEVVAMNMNAVIVHVRPFGDAMYDSDYFPWSRYASGTQGKDPGFDPLSIMVKEAHARGLEFHAWLNPYRITSSSTNVKDLSKDNPARIYRTDSFKKNDRNVLTYSGKLYYNPAVEEVQTLIINGIKEIVENYDVDGIHFDDYFYPSLGKNFTKNFDAKEYEVYKNFQVNRGKEYMSIADWRRNNVNTLVKNIYSTVKEIDPDVVFGISPGGFMDALKADDKYYVDFETWLSHDGYIDYLCPQLYWSNDHDIYPYDEILARFIDEAINPDVKLYVGIGAYKAGIKTEGTAWYKNKNVLRNMIREARDTQRVDGFALYSYRYLISKKNHAAIQNMMKEFK
ncbi:MAG: family 10 glycosylhydrolase [Lachnospiraceae bacterium]|nr:family 10 glycosylhydrolase [Lachnospiraceae bacterium]